MKWVCQEGRLPSGTGVYTARANACDCGVAAGSTVLGGLVAVQDCYFKSQHSPVLPKGGRGSNPRYLNQPHQYHPETTWEKMLANGAQVTATHSLCGPLWYFIITEYGLTKEERRGACWYTHVQHTAGLAEFQEYLPKKNATVSAKDERNMLGATSPRTRPTCWSRVSPWRRSSLLKIKTVKYATFTFLNYNATSLFPGCLVLAW